MKNFKLNLSKEEIINIANKSYDIAKNKILYKEKMKNEFSKENMLNDFDR